MPRNAASSPMGSSRGATPAPKRSRSWSRVRSKLARSRSSLLTKNMRGRPRSAASRQATSVCTSTPSTALTTITARSATSRAVWSVGDEVGVAGRVEEVDLVAVELEGGEGQGQRDAPLHLLGVEVGGGVAVLHPSLAVDGARAEQEGLGQARLPGSAVARRGRRCGSGREGSSSRAAPCCRRSRNCSPGVFRPKQHTCCYRRGEMFDKRCRAGVERGLRPVGSGLERAGVSADQLTVVGPAHLHRRRPRRRQRSPRARPPSCSPRPPSPTCSTGRWPRRRAPRRPGARSSTRSSTGSSDMVVLGGFAWYLASVDGGTRPCCRWPSWPPPAWCRTSGPGPSRSASPPGAG